MYAYFNYGFCIQMTYAQALSATHPGPCDSDVAILLRDKKIIHQLNKINPDDIRRELREYGAWDDNQLADVEENQSRIIWIAAGNIIEENPKRKGK